MDDYTAVNRKLVMPVMWDFDTVFETPGEWSRCHDRQFFFVHLFNSKNLAFTKAYVKAWRDFESQGKMDALKRYLADFAVGAEAQALNEARMLDARHYGTNYATVQNDVIDVLNWLNNRETWMQEQIFKMELSFNPDIALGFADSVVVGRSTARRKILRGGRILIKDGDNVYTLTGLKVK